MNTTGQRVLFWGWALLLTAFLMAHFTLIQLANMPLNPIRLALSSTINAYVNPLFTQNWSFFAPQPVDNDLSIVVRGRYSNGRTRTESSWTDVTDPLIDALRRSRLTPLQLEELMLSNAVVSFNNTINQSPTTTYLRNGTRYVRRIIPANVDPLDLGIITRTGMAVLERTYPSRQFTAVQIGVLVHQFPRFTKRDLPDTVGSTNFIRVQWQPAPFVTPF